MRTLVTSLIVGVAFVTGCIAASSTAAVGTADARTAPPPADNPWGYFCFESSSADDVTARANAAGVRGWELVTASPGEDGSIWCFKRPKQ